VFAQHCKGVTGGSLKAIQRFDQGPSLLLLPHLFRETFNDLGTSLDAEGVKLVKCEPNYNIHFHDATSIQLSTDIALMKEEIERFEGKDGFERYLGFLQESHRHYELSVEHVLRKNFYSLLSMLRLDFLKNVLALHPFESIYGRSSKYFYTERLRRVFTFASMYMGMSPFDAPGTYSLLQYTELAEGIWYPLGGFHKVCLGQIDALFMLTQPGGGSTCQYWRTAWGGVQVQHSRRPHSTIERSQTRNGCQPPGWYISHRRHGDLQCRLVLRLQQTPTCLCLCKFLA